MQPASCELCHRDLAPDGHYIVRIDAFADPALPDTTRAQLDALDFDAEIDNLLDEMKKMSADELQDQVHRRFEFRICPKCQRQFLHDPLGKSRRPN